MRDGTEATAPLILIADDAKDTREMYSLYLSMLGYRVEIAADGREAVIMTRKLRPDLIVLDLEMPRLDGWGAMRMLQRRPATASIPVIILTGHGFKGYLKHSAIAEGAVSYLMKPCLPDQLGREIGSRLGDRRMGSMWVNGA